MTRLGKILAALVLTVLTTFAFSSPAFAGDAVAGQRVFNGNCQACHRGGKNTLNPQKTLSKADLTKYGKFSEDAIVAWVTSGGRGMPSFSRLGPTNIENVAAYVLEQAEKGW